MRAEEGLTLKLSLLLLRGKVFLENTQEKKNSSPQELVKKRALHCVPSCQPSCAPGKPQCSYRRNTSVCWGGSAGGAQDEEWGVESSLPSSVSNSLVRNYHWGQLERTGAETTSQALGGKNQFTNDTCQ